MLICPTCLKQRPSNPSDGAPVCADDGSALVHELATYSATPDFVVGHVVGGRYLVERVLGEGGMGLVLAARHLALGRRAAVKLLHPSLAALPEIRARFLREARAAAELSDPAKRDPRIVTVNDFGETSNGMLYLVMELLSGVDLFSWSTTNGSSTWRDTAWLGVRIADALSVMHQRGYVHRDLKPENVWIGDPVDGAAETLDVKLLDFGVVGLLDTPEDRRLTRAGTTVGTPTYMAPEQIRGEPVDARADVYALACVLWELETGHAPYRAKTNADLFSHHLYEPIPSLRAESPGVPTWLANLLESCLAKDRSRRPVSAEEVATQLRQGLAAPERERNPEAAAAPTAPILATPRTRYRPWLVAAAVVAALACGALAFERLSAPDTPAPTATRAEPPKGPASDVPAEVLPDVPAEVLSDVPAEVLPVAPSSHPTGIADLVSPSVALVPEVAPGEPEFPVAPVAPDVGSRDSAAEDLSRALDESGRNGRRPHELTASKRPAKTGPRIRPPKVDDGLMEPR